MSADLQTFRERAAREVANADRGCSADQVDRYTRMADAVIAEFAKPTDASQRNIAEALRRQGFRVSQKLVGLLLREQKYSCQANRKTREGYNHPDRDAQFAHINATVKATIAAGEPAISVDTKKKELVGDFKNGGRELRRAGDPEPVRVHDFEIKSLGKRCYGASGEDKAPSSR